MKKVLCTSLVLLLIVSGITVAFAAESANTTIAATGTTTTTSSAVETTGAAVTIVPDMTFTGTPINLSLENAYKKMLADSPGAKMAELNKLSADGVSKGYGESVQSINGVSNFISNNIGSSNATTQAIAIQALWSLDTSNRPMLIANREYAKTQGPKNYEAEINKLQFDTLKNYYTLKEMENQEKIAIDNLALKEKLLSNTQLKFKLGTVSKNDVLKAEISVNEAKDQKNAATNALNTMRMGFNQIMGYDLMQKVVLSDTIKEVSLSTKPLKDSIQSALLNRNEMAGAAYNLQMSKFNFNSYKAYPESSASYIKARMAMLIAETGYKGTPLTIESDVRSKYMEMNAKYSAIQTGKKSVENAKETVRLSQLQYDTGMATLSNVEEAQLGYFNAQLSYSKALLQYNLAVNAYNLSSGVGIETAIIK